MMPNEVITVEVTAEDIAAGEPCKAAACPIARALARVTGLALSLSCSTNIGIGEGVNFTAEPAKAIDAFIRAFDHGRPVRPFTFTIEKRG